MANFNIFIPLLHEAEGGYQKHAKDNGNYNSKKELIGTNKGISAPVLERWIKRVPTETDMRNLTTETANKIYKSWYWDKLKGNDFKTQEVANLVVDHGVNAGTGAAGKLLQRTLNESFGSNLSVDGAIGAKTITTVNGVDQKKIQFALIAARERFYQNINQPTFLRGWLKRLEPFTHAAINFTQQNKTGVLTSILIMGGAFFFD